MKLFELLNKLAVETHVSDGEIALCPQEDEAFDGDVLKPEYRLIEEAETYFDRPHSDYPYTEHVRYGNEVARWCDSESEWVETSG